jgi:nucleotide-binding universal stress UspA family protein
MPAIEWNKIVCAIDFSDQSKAALRAATDLAKRVGAELVLLHVGNAPANEMGELEKAARAAGVGKVSSVVESGDPAARIVEFAEKGKFSLIVMGTHGRTGRMASLAGSVAETVVRRSHCPVLTLHDGWTGAK